MADAVDPFQRLRIDGLLEVRQLAGAAPPVDLSIAHHRDASRIVAAVLQPTESIDQDGNDFLWPEVSDNSKFEDLDLDLTLDRDSGLGLL